MERPRPDLRTRRSPSGEARATSDLSHPSRSAGAAVRPQDIAAYLRSLPLADLGAWLVDDDGYAERGYFPCPKCQRDRRDRLAQAPRALVAPDGLTWSCSRCRKLDTHDRLATIVLANPDVVMRVADFIATAGAP